MTGHPLPSENPYVGPRPFEEADAQAGRYYGREREARDLLALVARERLVLFYAQSGAGKSSLLRASLIPGLRDLGFDVLPIGRVTSAAPVAAEPGVANVFVYDLIRSLNEGLPERDRTPAGALMKTTLAEFLGGTAADDPDAASRLAPTVLLVDQFEEIVTGHLERWEDREAFFVQLRDALERLPRLWVVLTLREDYVAPLEPYAELLLNRLRGRYYMQRMGQEAALEAVRRPAATYGRPFAPEVAETLVDNLRRVRVPFSDEPELGEYVEPVQLQVVCQQLWARLQAAQAPGAGPQPAPSSITEADLPLGHIDQALTRFYEDALAEVLADPAAQAAGTDERRLRTWFDRELVTAEGMRSTVQRNEQTGLTGSLANAAVDRLARRYLVRTELRAGGAWVELMHDRLVEPIRTSNAAWFPQHLSPLQRQAALWDEQGRSDGLLLTGDALADAERWGEEHAAELAEEEQDFLAACQAARKRAEQEQRQSQRIRMLAIVAGIISILAIAAIISTFVARASAVVAFSQAATARAELARVDRSAATQQAAVAALQLAADAAESEAHALQQIAATALADAAAAQKQAAEKEAVVTQAVLQAQTALAFAEANLVANLTAQAQAGRASAEATLAAALTAQALVAGQATSTPQVTSAAVATPSAAESPTRPAKPQPPASPTPNLTVIAQQTELARVRVTQTALAAPAIPPPQGRIVYTSNGGSPAASQRIAFDLWVIDLARGAPRQLTFSSGWDPVYSRARDRILFTAQINEGKVDLFEVSPAGGDPWPIDEHSWSDWSGTYSPDGKRVTFTSSRDNQDWEVWTMGVDGGSKPQQLTRDDPALNWSPAWSPDGRTIAFFSTRLTRGATAEVWQMNTEGKSLTRLTNVNWVERTTDLVRSQSWRLSWSPKGDQIAYPSNRDGNWEIYIMDLQTQTERNLTNSPKYDECDPAWSPDGDWIALARTVSNGQMIVLKSIDGQQEIVLTKGIGIDRQPVWLP